MGYTHYWTQRRDYSVAAWKELAGNVLIIVNAGRKSVPLANWEGTPGTSPVIDDEIVSFNGVGADAHETFFISRRRAKKEDYEPAKGWRFCKTRQKPYDVVVTAVLAYLASCHEFDVSSDGDPDEWDDGVELAREALPRYADKIDVPKGVRNEEAA